MTKTESPNTECDVCGLPRSHHRTGADHEFEEHQLSPADRRTLENLRAEIRRQVRESIAEGMFGDADGRVDAATLDLIAVAMRTDASLDALARVADRALAWDSCAFVRACGVASRDIRAEDVTRAGYARLSRLNGAPFTYPLDGWST